MRRSAIALLVLSAACSAATNPVDRMPSELTQLPRPLSAAEKQVRTSGNAFAFSMLGRLAVAQRNENVFVSPVSASMALGMLLNGAAGNTATEMRQALALGDAPMAEVNQGYHDLMQLLRELDPGVELRIANGIWADAALPVNQSFLDAAKQYFEADARTVRFSDPATIAAINAWVSQHTNGRIKTIMDDATGDEVMVLANAIYFKGAWRKRFDAGQTTDAPFRGADGTSRTVKMMKVPAGSF
ncbi:MAG TPA: serpin family protein, partial [Gemmatimonadaceae bacterium]|nr:serpin family protein [Gemmatimonadaceae bacterium]